MTTEKYDSLLIRCALMLRLKPLTYRLLTRRFWRSLLAFPTTLPIIFRRLGLSAVWECFPPANRLHDDVHPLGVDDSRPPGIAGGARPILTEAPGTAITRGIRISCPF